MHSMFLKSTFPSPYCSIAGRCRVLFYVTQTHKHKTLNLFGQKFDTKLALYGILSIKPIERKRPILEQWKKRPLFVRLGLTAAGTLIICIFLFQLNITVPMMVLVSLMLFLTVLAGRAEGALCGVLSAGYACFFFSEYYQNLFQYTYQNKVNILVIVVSLFLNFVLAGYVKNFV